MPNHKPVIIESPYAGKTPAAYRRNIAYLYAAIQDCLKRGEVPYASHGFYPGALDDTMPEQRKQGIEAGFATAEVFQAVDGYRAFYTDRGHSTGMEFGRQHAERTGMLYIPRTLGEEWAPQNDPVQCDHPAVVEAGREPEFKLDMDVCPDCGAKFRVVALPEDAIKVALDYLKKKA